MYRSRYCVGSKRQLRYKYRTLYIFVTSYLNMISVCFVILHIGNVLRCVHLFIFQYDRETRQRPEKSKEKGRGTWPGRKDRGPNRQMLRLYRLNTHYIVTIEVNSFVLRLKAAIIVLVVAVFIYSLKKRISFVIIFLQ